MAKVLIELATPSLGDTIGWLPQAEEYRIKYLDAKDQVDITIDERYHCLFEKEYPQFNFYTRKDPSDYDEAVKVDIKDLSDLRRNIIEVATTSLGLPYKEIRPRIALPKLKNNFKKPYVCIATQSTAQFKFWNNPDGWRKTIKYLRSKNYEVVSIDQHECYGVEGWWNHTPVEAIRKNDFNDGVDRPPITLPERVNDLYFCDFFIGLSSGLSWLSWAMKKPTIMIAGGSREDQEFYTPYKVINKSVCHCCAANHNFDRSKWAWCPEHEGTDRQFECTKKISFEMVKQQIDRLL